MKRPLTIWCLVAASLVGVVAWADLVLVFRMDPTYPVAPTEYDPPTAPVNLTAMESGATVITPADSTELSSLLSGGTVDSTTLAAALTAGPTVIKLDRTVTYTGNFEFDNTTSNWLYVTTDGYDSLPASGTRATTAHATAMVAVNPPDVFSIRPSVSCVFNSQNIRFFGIKSSFPTAGGNDSIAFFQCGHETYEMLNGSTADTLAEMPADIIIDRCLFQGRNTSGQEDREGVRFNVDGGAILDSSILNISNDSPESIGIFIFNGSDRILVQNCAVSASGINIIVGGVDSAIGRNDSNLVFRGNHLFKEPEWFTTHPSYDSYDRSVKNLFELKKAEKVLIEGNILEDVGDSDGGQAMSGFVFTIRNQSGGDTFASVKDVEVRHNIVRRVGSAFVISNQDDINNSGTAERLYIHDNIIYDSNFYNTYTSLTYPLVSFPSNQNISQMGEWIRIEHNTFAIGANGVGHEFGPFVNMVGSAESWDNLVIKDNIAEGINTDLRPAVYPNSTNVTTGLDNFCVAYEVTSNVVFEENAGSTNWPSGNFFPAKASVGFTDYNNADFELASGDYRAGQANDASDGTDMGADIAAVEAATTGVIP